MSHDDMPELPEAGVGVTAHEESGRTYRVFAVGFKNAAVYGPEDMHAYARQYAEQKVGEAGIAWLEALNDEVAKEREACLVAVMACSAFADEDDGSFVLDACIDAIRARKGAP